jgi:hypothetical protein
MLHVLSLLLPSSQGDASSPTDAVIPPPPLPPQAVSPFIDKVTAKKIHFVNKGDKGEGEQMAALFSMEHMDSCMGGSSSTPMFSLEEYAQRMRQGDDQVAQQLAQAAAAAAEAEADAEAEASKVQASPAPVPVTVVS